MKTVFVQSIGVDISNNKTFGDVNAIAEDSEFLILVKQERLYNVEYSLNYRITDDGYIQLIMYIDGKPSSIVAQLEIVGETLKKQLSLSLVGYMMGTSFFMGFPEYIGSPILTRPEFDSLVGVLMTIKEKNNAVSKGCKTKLIHSMENAGLHPTPDDWNTTKWHANCPGSGKRHMLLISTKTNDWEWKCDYCNRQGDYDDFIEWIEHISC
jgi:hypothetical protein